MEFRNGTGRCGTVMEELTEYNSENYGKNMKDLLKIYEKVLKNFLKIEKIPRIEIISIKTMKYGTGKHLWRQNR